MTKEIIFDWGCHVIKNLPHDQGPNGKGVLLNLDFHNSRMNVKFQWFMLMKGSVFVNHGPSHTSTCGQPCDLGSNMCMHQAVATVAEDNAKLSSESNSMFLNNRNVYEALCLQTDTQNDELRRTGRNAGVSGFKKSSLHPFSYSGSKFQEAEVQFGKLAKVLKRRGLEEDQDTDEETIFWTVRLKDPDKRVALSKDEQKALQDEVCPEWDEENLGEPPHHYFLANAKARLMLDEYLEEENRSKADPPQPKSCTDRLAMKLMGFIPASMHASVVPSNPNDFKIAKVNTILSIAQIGRSVDIRKKGSKLKMSAMKQDVNRFVIFDRRIRSEIVLTKQDILENYDVDKPALPFTDKDKKKSEKMKRLKRKRDEEENQTTAKEIAEERRDTRMLSLFKDIRRAFEAGDVDEMAAFKATKEVFDGDASTDVELSIGDDGESKTYRVEDPGRKKCAISSAIEKTLLKMARRGGDEAPKKRRKTKRGAKISTKKGAPGWAIGVFMQHNTALARQDALEASVQKDQKNVEGLKKLLDGVKKAKEDRPQDYWQIGVAGYASARKWIASLFAVKNSGSGRRVQQVDDDLKAKNITQELFDEKIEELKTRIEKLQSSVDGPARIALQNEANNDVEIMAAHLRKADLSAAQLVTRNSETREGEDLPDDKNSDGDGDSEDEN
jgi:hypothetical protein